MMVFYCDLDNTLIYSHRHEIGADKVGVESYQGEEISFMTQASVAMLKKLRKQVLFVPTTTRTPEQYGRVRLGKTPPEYALVCNGGMLLRHGVPDELWYQQTRLLIAPCSSALVQAEGLLWADVDRCFEPRFLHQLFLFSKSSHPVETVKRLCAEVDTNQLAVFSQGSKIYVLPRSLTKAYAVRRLNQLLGNVVSFAAGDSPMDAGMLAEADKAFAPQALAQTMQPSQTVQIISENRVFSDVFLSDILETTRESR